MEENSALNVSKPKFLAYYEKYMLAVGVLGQLMFFIQGIKIFTSQSAKDVSIVGFTIGLVSVASWMVYGLLIKNRVVLFANVIAVIGALFVVTGILIYS